MGNDEPTIRQSDGPSPQGAMGGTSEEERESSGRGRSAELVQGVVGVLLLAGLVGGGLAYSNHLSQQNELREQETAEAKEQAKTQAKQQLEQIRAERERIAEELADEYCTGLSAVHSVDVFADHRETLRKTALAENVLAEASDKVERCGVEERDAEQRVVQVLADNFCSRIASVPTVADYELIRQDLAAELRPADLDMDLVLRETGGECRTQQRGYEARLRQLAQDTESGSAEKTPPQSQANSPSPTQTASAADEASYWFYIREYNSTVFSKDERAIALKLGYTTCGTLRNHSRAETIDIVTGVSGWAKMEVARVVVAADKFLC